MKSPYVHTKYSEQLQNPTLIDNSSVLLRTRKMHAHSDLLNISHSSRQLCLRVIQQLSG